MLTCKEVLRIRYIRIRESKFMFVKNIRASYNIIDIAAKRVIMQHYFLSAILMILPLNKKITDI